MNTEQEIAAFIVEYVRAAQRISGARLGYELSSRVAGFRQRFGALRTFVQKYCSGQVAVFPASELGGDVFYAPASSPTAAEAPTAPTSTAPALDAQDSAWRAFTAPNSVSRLCINRESADFRVRPKTDPEPLAPWLAVPSATPDDHRQIASDFLAQIAAEDRGAFEEITKLPHFWPSWVTKILTFQQGRYKKQWAEFRFNKLCDLYLARLKSIGLGEELAAESLRRLKALKSASRKLAQVTASQPSATSPSTLSIRKLAIAALEAMSEDELRQIWLPLGSLADVIGKCQSR